MTETDQSTPQPWHAEELDESGHIVIADAQDVSICRCYQQPHDTWTAAANAAVILKAVNFHEELIKALQVLDSHFTRWLHHCATNRNLAARIEAEQICIRVILAKAIGNEPQPATDRPGDQAAVMHEETGIDYETCLVMCNMD